VTKEEIALWELFNPDIFAYVKDGKVWFDPVSNQPLEQCPFLEIETPVSANSAVKFTCSIYQDRPEDCRHYPSLVSEMIRDGCEMIETVDLDNLKKAQSKLDILIRDER
jgi:Fe-S-cluster containining protein